jgi:protein-S-isoprenylcysteine O-methyltransferase Ste14
MKATDFELRHQTLLHMIVVGLAFATYAIAPDDIVWLIVRDSPHNRLLERSFFAFAGLLIGAAAAICTWARAYRGPEFAGASASVSCDGPYSYLRYPLHLGTLLYAMGLGSLAPVPGFIILVLGDALIVFRLIRRTDELERTATSPQDRPRLPRLLPSFRPCFPAKGCSPNWKKAFRQESGKWGLFLTMIIFTIVLIDRVADYLVLASLVLGLLLNLPSFTLLPMCSKFPPGTINRRYFWIWDSLILFNCGELTVE